MLSGLVPSGERGGCLVLALGPAGSPSICPSPVFRSLSLGDLAPSLARAPGLPASTLGLLTLPLLTFASCLWSWQTRSSWRQAPGQAHISGLSHAHGLVGCSWIHRVPEPGLLLYPFREVHSLWLLLLLLETLLENLSCRGPGLHQSILHTAAARTFAANPIWRCPSSCPARVLLWLQMLKTKQNQYRTFFFNEISVYKFESQEARK